MVAIETRNKRGGERKKEKNRERKNKKQKREREKEREEQRGCVGVVLIRKKRRS
jgi:hypothetical protein